MKSILKFLKSLYEFFAGDAILLATVAIAFAGTAVFEATVRGQNLGAVIVLVGLLVLGLVTTLANAAGKKK